MMSWARASEEQKISLSDRRAALFDYVLLLLLLPARNAVVVVVDRGDCILITLRTQCLGSWTLHRFLKNMEIILCFEDGVLHYNSARGRVLTCPLQSASATVIISPSGRIEGPVCACHSIGDTSCESQSALDPIRRSAAIIGQGTHGCQLV